MSTIRRSNTAGQCWNVLMILQVFLYLICLVDATQQSNINNKQKIVPNSDQIDSRMRKTLFDEEGLRFKKQFKYEYPHLNTFLVQQRSVLDGEGMRFKKNSLMDSEGMRFKKDPSLLASEGMRFKKDSSLLDSEGMRFKKDNSLLDEEGIRFKKASSLLDEEGIRFKKDSSLLDDEGMRFRKKDSNDFDDADDVRFKRYLNPYYLIDQRSVLNGEGMRFKKASDGSLLDNEGMRFRRTTLIPLLKQYEQSKSKPELGMHTTELLLKSLPKNSKNKVVYYELPQNKLKYLLSYERRSGERSDNRDILEGEGMRF